MRVIDKTKLSKGIVSYLNKKFDYFHCEIEEDDDFGNILFINIWKEKSFQCIRRGIVKVILSKKSICFYIKEKYIEKYDFDKFKAVLKDMEKDLKVNVVLEIVPSFPDFEEDD